MRGKQQMWEGAHTRTVFPRASTAMGSAAMSFARKKLHRQGKGAARWDLRACTRERMPGNRDSMRHPSQRTIQPQSNQSNVASRRHAGHGCTGGPGQGCTME
jgi:hypothetical protein